MEPPPGFEPGTPGFPSSSAYEAGALPLSYGGSHYTTRNLLSRFKYYNSVGYDYSNHEANDVHVGINEEWMKMPVLAEAKFLTIYYVARDRIYTLINSSY